MLTCAVSCLLVHACVYVCCAAVWALCYIFVCVHSQVRTAVGVAAIGGFLFAVGGECEGCRSYEPTQYLETVECYDPKTNTWSEKAKMSQPRSFAAVAVLNGELPGLIKYSCMYLTAADIQSTFKLAVVVMDTSRLLNEVEIEM